MQKKFVINQKKIKGGSQSGKKVITHNSKNDLPLDTTNLIQISLYNYVVCSLPLSLSAEALCFARASFPADGITSVFNRFKSFPKPIKWTKTESLFIDLMVPSYSTFSATIRHASRSFQTLKLEIETDGTWIFLES